MEQRPWKGAPMSKRRTDVPDLPGARSTDHSLLTR
jgi:hypothetical protein